MTKPSKISLQFGTRCREIRHILGLSIADVAQRSGLTQAAICQIETGKRSPQLDSAVKLAKGLGAKLSRLLGES